MSRPAQSEKGAASIARGAAVVGGATLGSRVLGLVRDTVVAAYFDKMATDVFFTAFTIPNVLRRLLGEGALTAILVPVYTEVRVREGDERARGFVASALGAGLGALVAITLLGILLSPWIVMGYAWGFQKDDPEKFSLCVTATQVMWPYLVFVGLCAIAMGVLNAHRRFFWPAFSPALLNLSIIGATVLGASRLEAAGRSPVWALALGVLLGGALQAASQIIPMRRIDRLPRPRFRRDPAVAKVVRLLGPSVIGLAIYQVDILLSRLFASLLAEGSVSYLYYSMRLVELPQAVFVMAIAAAALPSLSEAEARDDREEAKRTYRRSLTMSSFVAVPSVIVLTVMAIPVTAVLFQRGEFGWDTTRNTAASLAWCALGIPGVAGVRNTSPVFYALQDTRTPMKLSAVNLALYVGLCLSLMWRYAHVGIAIGIGMAANAQFVLQIVFLRRKIGALGLAPAAIETLRHLVAGAALAGVCLAVGLAGRWEEGGNPYNAGILAAALCAGGAAYFCTAWILRARDARAIADGLARRLRSSRGTSP